AIKTVFNAAFAWLRFGGASLMPTVPTRGTAKFQNRRRIATQGYEFCGGIVPSLYKEEGRFYENSSSQTLNCGSLPQNQRESRRWILEQAEGDRRRAPHAVVGFGRCNRFRATTR